MVEALQTCSHGDVTVAVQEGEDACNNTMSLLQEVIMPRLSLETDITLLSPAAQSARRAERKDIRERLLKVNSNRTHSTGLALTGLVMNPSTKLEAVFTSVDRVVKFAKSVHASSDDIDRIYVCLAMGTEPTKLFSLMRDSEIVIDTAYDPPTFTLTDDEKLAFRSGWEPKDGASAGRIVDISTAALRAFPLALAGDSGLTALDPELQQTAKQLYFLDLVSTSRPPIDLAKSTLNILRAKHSRFSAGLTIQESIAEAVLVHDTKQSSIEYPGFGKQGARAFCGFSTASVGVIRQTLGGWLDLSLSWLGGGRFLESLMDARGFIERHGGHGEAMYGQTFERLILDLLAVATAAVEGDRKAGILQNSRANLSLVFGPIDVETGAIKRFGAGWKQSEKAKLTSMCKELALRGASGITGGHPSITILLKVPADSAPIDPPSKKLKKDDALPEKRKSDDTTGANNVPKKTRVMEGQPGLRKPVNLAKTYVKLIKEAVKAANEDFNKGKRDRSQAGKAYGNLDAVDFWGQRLFVDEAWARHKLEGKEMGAFVEYSGSNENKMTRNCLIGRVCPGTCVARHCKRKSTHATAKLLPLTTRISIQKLADELAAEAGVESVNTDLPDATDDPDSDTGLD